MSIYHWTKAVLTLLNHGRSAEINIRFKPANIYLNLYD